MLAALSFATEAAQTVDASASASTTVYEGKPASSPSPARSRPSVIALPVDQSPKHEGRPHTRNAQFNDDAPQALSPHCGALTPVVVLLHLGSQRFSWIGVPERSRRRGSCRPSHWNIEGVMFCYASDSEAAVVRGDQVIPLRWLRQEFRSLLQGNSLPILSDHMRSFQTVLKIIGSARFIRAL